MYICIYIYCILKIDIEWYMYFFRLVDYNDELVWVGVWLYKVINEIKYLI